MKDKIQTLTSKYKLLVEDLEKEIEMYTGVMDDKFIEKLKWEQMVLLRTIHELIEAISCD